MGVWVNTATPGVLALDIAEWEESARRTSVRSNGSPAPIPFEPLPFIEPYTHLGHAAQYGDGRRNGRTIRLIALHITDVDGTALGAASYDARRPDQVSATVFIGPEGELVYDVDESDRPFTTGRWNDEHISAEIIGHDEWTAEKWRSRPRQMAAITTWLVAVCRRHDIPPNWLSPAQIAEGASRNGEPPVQGTIPGICDHLNANMAARLLGASAASTSHVCVGPGLRTVLFEDILPEVARQLAPTPPDPTPPDEDDDDMKPFIVQKANGETALIYGDGKMTGLLGPDIPRYVKRFGDPILTEDITYNDFASKGDDKLTVTVSTDDA